MNRPWWALTGTILSLSALAQRVDENAVTAADDAFGTTVGSQTIGSYDSDHVRGFSPREAGNLRIEGLYFDQQTYVPDRCLVVEQAVKVGLSAQSFDIPSPTGIANYTLHTTGPKDLLSVLLSRGPFEAAAVELDGQFARPAMSLSASVCLHGFQNSDIDAGRGSRGSQVGGVLRWRPAGSIEVTSFWGVVSGVDQPVLPVVYIDGVTRPPAFRESQLPTQEWTRWRWDESTAGVIGQFAGTGSWSGMAGLFRSEGDYPIHFNDLFVDLDSARTVDHVLDISPPVHAESISGEARLVRRAATNTHLRKWSIAVRGRDVKRTFGGDAITDFGRVSIDDHDALTNPPPVFTATSEDRVRQVGLSASFDERWPGRGSLGVGVQKVA